MARDGANRSASRSARGRKRTWQPVTPESSPRSARRDPGGVAQSGTVDRYDRIAVGYQRWWAPVIAPAALRLLDLVASTVVDRPGTLARAAVAPAPGMLAVGEREAARTLASSDVRRLDWRTGTAERLPLADGGADAVVSSFAFHHVRGRSAALREARRVLRPGGMIAVVTWLAACLLYTSDAADDLTRVDL